METIVVFSVIGDIVAIEEAKRNLDKGNKVIFVLCDKSVGLCVMNRRGSESLCKLCTHIQKNTIKKQLQHKNLNLFSISDFITKEIIDYSYSISFSYNSNEELKSLKFKGVEVGYGAFSTYVTLTRHCNPLYNSNVKNYIDGLLRLQVREALAIEEIIKVYQPNQIIFHNGRFAQFKPFLNIAQNKGIDYIATEVLYRDNRVYKTNFKNDIPHSVSSLSSRITQSWLNTDKNSREEIGNKFFEFRRGAKWAGDKVYVQHQKKGLLPDNIDLNKENIVIFNSSEDEYLSISSEYDNARLFKTQYEGLIEILEQFKDDKKKHFYLRIHPNLGKVDDISHLALYNLKYDNLTVIPADSPISTYALMDIADKVIVFNSTTGVEAAYWGKPVIAIDLCFYSAFQIAYQPKNVEELFQLIKTNKLENKSSKEDLLKIGVYLLNPYKEEISECENRIVELNLFRKLSFRFPKLYKFLGSSVLIDFVFRTFPLLPFIKKSYQNVPLDRNLWMADIKD